MKQRLLIWGGIALLVLMILVVRFGCRGSADLPDGDSYEARMQQIDIMRQRQELGDIQRLVTLAEEDAGSIRSAAMFALAEFKGSQAGDPLCQIENHSGDASLRATAAEALGRRGEGIPRLMEIVTSESDAAVRVGALRGLVTYSTTERRDALPTFLAALRDDDPEVRNWAMRGVTEISKKRFLYEPDKSPATQAERIAFIERRMKDLGLLD